jgi:4a-hydroxytetrahydrobiopterin dehydratase
MTAITVDEFLASDDTGDWRALCGASYVATHFVAPSLATATAFVVRVSELAQETPEHFEVHLNARGVTIRLARRGVGGGEFAEEDVVLARQISNVAREMQLSCDITHVQHTQIALDADDIAAVRPFWQAVLRYESKYDTDLLDPTGEGPTMWFQKMREPRTERGRFHVDVYVPREQAAERIAAALAAGGHIVNDSRAPMWWTLADCEGNEADIAIWT